MPIPTDGKPPTVKITLVHGTWGQMRLPFSGPRWFDDDSAFAIELRRLLELAGETISIEVLEWSGANSLKARRHAADRLRKKLWRQAGDESGTRHVIIGHSHGGSVCALALRDLPDGIDPAVITMATPFVEVVNADPKGRAAQIKSLVSSGIGPVLLLGIVTIVESLFEVPVLGWLFKSYGAFVVAANGLNAVYGLPNKDEPGEGQSELDWLRPQKRDFKFFVQATIGGATIDPPRRMLVLRGVDDEAGLVLAAGSIGSRLLSTFVSLSFRATTVLTIIFVAIVALGAAQLYWPQFTPMRDFIRATILAPNLIYFTYACIASIYLLPLLSGLFKCVYGSELLLKGFFCEIKSASVPDARSGLSVITLPPSNRSGMRHGIYRHELAPAAIADFIQSTRPKTG